jgi:transcriptional regulator with XRE-family HTH domain
VDRVELADFLRRRRAALQPEDVGLIGGPRRRTQGLRREEVAALASISTDYYTRIEQNRGSRPSTPLLRALARALRMSLEERDHLLRLAGYPAPSPSGGSDHVSPALMHVLDRLDTPAQVMSSLAETLVQNPMSVALLGDQTCFTGFERSVVFRWFSDPDHERRLYLEADHEHQSRAYVSCFRVALARDGDDRGAASMVRRLRKTCPEFARLWEQHAVGIHIAPRQTLLHEMVGPITLDCQVLQVQVPAQIMLVYTARPGTEDDEKLQLLSVIGAQRFGVGTPTPTLPDHDARQRT